MSVRCSTIIEKLQDLAPEKRAEDWDNVGLLVGSPEQKVERILVSLDVTPEVIQEAVDKKIDMIVSHHPFIFNPVKNVRTDRPMGAMLKDLLNNNIVVYSLHTNLDVVSKGVSEILAEKFNLRDVEVLSATYEEKLYKLVVFVPEDYTRKVRDALGAAGAGFIGNYSYCTFKTEGIGTFKPEEGTNPFIGEQGKIEEVKEDRLETIISEGKLKRVLNAMLEAHPYEEVAYDLYPVIKKGNKLGLGRIGTLAGEATLGDIALHVKKVLSTPMVKVVGRKECTVKKVAVCGGAGGSLIKEAWKKGAELYITGDIKYHEARMAEELGMCLIDAGHWATEVPVVSFLKKYLDDLTTVEVLISEKNNDAFWYL